MGDPWAHIFAIFGYPFFEDFLGSLWIPFRIDFGTILASILASFFVLFQTPGFSEKMNPSEARAQLLRVRGSQFSHIFAIFFGPCFQTLFFLDFERFWAPFWHPFWIILVTF